VHDVLDLRDIVSDEWRQLDSSGYEVAGYETTIRDAVARNDLASLEALKAQLRDARRTDSWSYDEPSGRDEINARLTPAAALPWTLDDEALLDRLHGAWLARCVGCAMGKPIEGLNRPTLELYLRAADLWPQTGYVPLVEPLPGGVSELHWSWPESVAGAFDAMPRDDDTDYTVLGLYLMEQYGTSLTTDDVAREWLDRLPFTQTFTAERATYRNLIRGYAPAVAAATDNPYREWIGALIRADALGYVAPGNPQLAVDLAFADASLSHLANGIYGEMWAAALISAAFTAPDVRAALEVALSWVPEGTRLREALELVLKLHADGLSWSAAVTEIDALVGHYDWVHTINNAAGISAALLWGRGDLVDSAAKAISLGWDSDSSAATVGSVLGAMQGRAVVPERLAAPMHDRIRSAIRDYDRSSISGLAARTASVARAIRSQEVNA
jgi:ADP-ribosylglycohydrolase